MCVYIYIYTQLNVPRALRHQSNSTDFVVVMEVEMRLLVQQERNDCRRALLLLKQCEREGKKEMFYLTMHSTHFIYGYMASDIW